jgi:hypothetical protein
MKQMTTEEWEDLEPRLAAAERAAHDEFMATDEVRELTGGAEFTPGYLLLQRLKLLKDPEAIRFFRAMEMYHHELTRADINAAFQRGRETAEGQGKSQK